MLSNGPIILRGKTAEAFMRQIDNPVPNKLAQESFERGLKMVKEFERNGFVRILPRKK